MSPALALALLLAAEPADGGSLADQIDAAAQAPQPDAGAAPAGSSLLDQIDAAAGAPTPAAKPAQQSSPVARAFQSLNPDLSVIADITGGFGRHAPYSLAGDDPDLKGGPVDHSAGFTVQEAEVGLQSVVDPYFRGELYLTVPNLEGLEVEEAVVTTTALPADLQARAGVFRSAFGRQNGQHLHLQDFTRRPLVNAAYLGPDGLRSPGAQLSWLVPLPFFLQLTGEAFSVAPPEEEGALATFGGGKRTDLTYTLEAKVFVPASESVSVYGGLNAAFGRESAPVLVASDASARLDAPSQLYGLDLYLKYKPANEVGGYFNLAWQSELFVRHVDALCGLGRDACAPGQFLRGEQTDGGGYTQLVAHLARRWIAGARFDLLGLPESELQPRVTRESLSLTFTPSEFSRIRLYAEREDARSAETNYAGYLQLEVAMGAHGAHPF